MARELLFNENPNKFKKGCKHALNGDIVLTSEQQSHITGGKWWGENGQNQILIILTTDLWKTLAKACS